MGRALCDVRLRGWRGRWRGTVDEAGASPGRAMMLARPSRVPVADPTGVRCRRARRRCRGKLRRRLAAHRRRRPPGLRDGVRRRALPPPSVSGGSRARSFGPACITARAASRTAPPRASPPTIWAHSPPPAIASSNAAVMRSRTEFSPSASRVRRPSPRALDLDRCGPPRPRSRASRSSACGGRSGAMPRRLRGSQPLPSRRRTLGRARRRCRARAPQGAPSSDGRSVERKAGARSASTPSVSARRRSHAVGARTSPSRSFASSRSMGKSGDG